MPGAGYEGVTRFVLDVMTSYGLNACPPLLVGVGVATSVETAALLSKQVDWIEAPAPDAILPPLAWRSTSAAGRTAKDISFSIKT